MNATPTLPARSADRLADQLAGFPVVSCDIFDTAVMRRLARPEDLLLIVGAMAAARKLITCAPEAFREYRLEAERDARRAALGAGWDEVRLAEVYERLARTGVLAGTAVPDQLAELELAAECAVCRPVEAVRQALFSLAPGQRLVFVSDTMLPGTSLARLLRHCGYGEHHTVFSSADARLSKDTGRLFPHVVEALGCSPQDVVHIGDNPVSDMARARAHGLNAIHLPCRRAPPEPSAVAAQHHVVRLISSFRRSRGAAADTAAWQDRRGASVPPLHHYATTLLIGFSLHVLAEARRRGIKRIYFLARDGYLPFGIVKRLVERSGEAFELKYLHVSRQATIVPSLGDDMVALAKQVGDSLSGQPLSAALDFIGIDAATTAGWLQELGLDPRLPVDTRGDPSSLLQLFQARADSIRARLGERRAAALAYLEQSGFLVPGPRIVVDVGWRGSVQSALAKLTGMPDEAIVGCYLGLLPGAMRAGLDMRNASGYLFSFGHPRSIMETVLEGYVLLELFFSAPHSSVQYYKERNGRVEPVHAVEHEPDASVRRQALLAIEAGCQLEFDALDAMLDGAWPEALDAASALFDLAALLTRPTAQEVAAINRIPFIGGSAGGPDTVAVNPMSLRDFLRNPAAAIRRLENAPWRSGKIRASLPWPASSMSFHELRYRLEKLQRLLGRTTASAP
jgi:FMN phosphatase YigB (HAD superfamily)